MRVFVTGATGFIGSVVTQELITAGHQVLGLSRSDAGAKLLSGLGAEVQHGDLDDLESLRTGASSCDGVIHTAFVHDFSKFKENCDIDARAIETLGSALTGTGRPLVVTSGTGFPGPSGLATEDMPPPAELPRVSEQTALRFVSQDVRAMTVRLPQVHDRDKQGLVSYLIAIAKRSGVSAYIGEGRNQWTAVHRLDVPSLYRIALERGIAGAAYNAVSEQGIALKDIAEAIGRGLKIPVVSQSAEEAAAHFGPLAFFVGANLPASSALTQERLAWRPTHTTTMLADLENATDFAVA